MEEYALDIIIGKGPSARTLRLSIPKISLIGATTKLALLSAPLRDRFGLLLRLDYYAVEEMKKIIKRSCQLLKLPISDKAIDQIALRSRKTPRIANRLLKRAKDLFDVNKHQAIDESVLDNLFSMLEIDSLGLTDIDLKYLNLLGKQFPNTPLGVETIASSLAEDRETIEQFIEPYLLQLGFIKKSSRGRMLTPKALNHLGIEAKTPEVKERSKQPPGLKNNIEQKTLV